MDVIVQMDLNSRDSTKKDSTLSTWMAAMHRVLNKHCGTSPYSLGEALVVQRLTWNLGKRQKCWKTFAHIPIDTRDTARSPQALWPCQFPPQLSTHPIHSFAQSNDTLKLVFQLLYDLFAELDLFAAITSKVSLWVKTNLSQQNVNILWAL